MLKVTIQCMGYINLLVQLEHNYCVCISLSSTPAVPAKTCVVELQNCFIDLNALKEEGVPSPEDLIEICQ